ncbi:MAG TPA: phosphate ABC transporter permease subunit PstC [Jatrophihabitantaceae bacterium]|jgi:phosphate transport system permease protein|nr:phosphate ABC transporter permease subunit PstC [Jatrophihabitantaceae bacterium]
MPEPKITIEKRRPEHSVLIGSEQPEAIVTFIEEPPVAGAGVTSVGGSGRNRLGDRLFSGFARGSGIFIIVLVALIGIFLLIQAAPAIQDDTGNFFGHQWQVSTGNADFGISGLLWATVISSLIAMMIAVPIAVGIALFMTQYAPRRFTAPIGYVIDLLAAIPSVIYGIWGFTTLSGYLAPVQRVLYHLGGLPIFKDQGFITGTIFDGAVVLAIMILPIVTAIARDVFARTPRANIEAAWALGATRWEMIRLAVLPFGRAGVVSGAMLGLGRALGETIAVSLILSAPSSGANFTTSVFNGGETFASKIANSSGEFANNPGPYIAAGLVLFVLTFVVNAIARGVVARKGVR